MRASTRRPLAAAAVAEEGYWEEVAEAEEGYWEEVAEAGLRSEGEEVAKARWRAAAAAGLRLQVAPARV